MGENGSDNPDNPRPTPPPPAEINANPSNGVSALEDRVEYLKEEKTEGPSIPEIHYPPRLERFAKDFSGDPEVRAHELQGVLREVPSTLDELWERLPTTVEDKQRLQEMRDEYVIRTFRAIGQMRERDPEGFSRELREKREEIAQTDKWSLSVEDIRNIEHTLEGSEEEKRQMAEKIQNEFLRENIPYLMDEISANPGIPLRYHPTGEVLPDGRGSAPIILDRREDRDQIQNIRSDEAMRDGDLLVIAAALQSQGSRWRFEESAKAEEQWLHDRHTLPTSWRSLDSELLRRAQEKRSLYSVVNSLLQRRLGIDGGKLWNTPWSEIIPPQPSVPNAPIEIH